jgi:hypothetical protein
MPDLLELKMNGLGSEPFKFTIEGHEIWIHRDLVSSLSEPLERLVNGVFKEAADKEANTLDADYATFYRFVQWAYFGSYQPAAPQLRPTTNEETPGDRSCDGLEEKNPVVSLDDDAWLFGTISKKKSKKKFRKDSDNPFAPPTRREAFVTMNFLEASDTQQLPEPRQNNAETEDYTAVFLSHVKLYIFAEYWGVQPLERRALTDLHKTLCIFEITPTSVPALAPMIAHAYENTLPNEPIREMLSRFMGYAMKQLVKSPEFQKLLENNDIAQDFCGQLGAYFDSNASQSPPHSIPPAFSFQS